MISLLIFNRVAGAPTKNVGGCGGGWREPTLRIWGKPGWARAHPPRKHVVEQLNRRAKLLPDIIGYALHLCYWPRSGLLTLDCCLFGLLVG